MKSRPLSGSQNSPQGTPTPTGPSKDNISSPLGALTPAPPELTQTVSSAALVLSHHRDCSSQAATPLGGLAFVFVSLNSSIHLSHWDQIPSSALGESLYPSQPSLLGRLLAYLIQVMLISLSHLTAVFL